MKRALSLSKRTPELPLLNRKTWLRSWGTHGLTCVSSLLRDFYFLFLSFACPRNGPETCVELTTFTTTITTMLPCPTSLIRTSVIVASHPGDYSRETVASLLAGLATAANFESARAASANKLVISNAGSVRVYCNDSSSFCMSFAGRRGWGGTCFSLRHR